MRFELMRRCGAGLCLWMLFAGCGDSPAREQQTAPSTTTTVSGGASGANSAGQQMSKPASAMQAPTEATPGAASAGADAGRVPAGPADAGVAKLDAGRLPAGPTDAGAAKLDAASATPAASNATDAGVARPATDDAATGPQMTAPRLPPVTSVTMDGPFMTTVDDNAGPERAGLVLRPATLGERGLKHPVFIWGPGRGTRVRDYESLMRRIASHGFVVYSEISQAADGTEMIAAMTWLISENQRSSSPYYQKLDEDKIGVGGHSFGSNSAMSASSDPRVKAFVHTAGSGFRGAGKALNLKQPAAFICGENDPTANVTDCRTDYMQTSSPVFFTIIAGEDHLSTPSAGLPLVVAWLRWHLGDEAERKRMFIGTGCEFCTGVYTSESKNWN